LEIAFLDILPRAGEGTRQIAFLYGWNAKGVFHAFKAGYDEAFAEYSPGQLLIHEILEQFFRTQSHQIFDCIGPATEATRRWQTSDYEAGRVVIAPRNLLGQAAFFAYKHLAPTLRRWRSGIKSSTASPTFASMSEQSAE
jgi:CelD/BcsL family acetyltransferase involved in cellulose biosynthesis